MTMLYQVKARCAVCGTESEYTTIISTNEMGSPDLDTRPPEMNRSNILAWVQRCSECGYCASDVRQASSLANSIIHDPAYIRQLNDETCPELANSFLCKAFIEDALGDYGEEAWTLIHAAWACDDEGNTESARKCRSKASDTITKAVEKGQQFAELHGAEIAIQTDLPENQRVRSFEFTFVLQYHPWPDR